MKRVGDRNKGRGEAVVLLVKSPHCRPRLGVKLVKIPNGPQTHERDSFEYNKF